MAKNGKSNGTAAHTNGGLIFDVMADDFEVPTIIKSGSQFEPLLAKLSTLPAGKVAVAFKAPYEKARTVYTKGKALQKYALRMGTPVETAVRKNPQTNEAWLYVQLGQAETVAPSKGAKASK